VTQDLKDRFFYRRMDDGAPSSDEVARRLQAEPGLVIVDVRPRMILVEQDGGGPRPAISGWSDFSVQTVPLPDARPRLRK
jgi:hypothetical protein